VFLARTACTLAGVALALGAVVAPAQAAQTPPPGADPVIIGGEQARDTQGAVRLFKEGDGRCTGTIIDEEWVLTAAHCVKDVDDDDADEVSVKVGDVDQEKGEEVHAKEHGIHRNDDADLALVNLEHPVEAEYAKLGNKLLVGGLANRTAHIYGWGAWCSWPIPEGLCQSRTLKTASVTIDDSRSCEDLKGGHALCANFGDGISAGGDSGGPMFVRAMNGKTYQVGVSSSGDRDEHMEYTNVMEYGDWIEDVMDD
jgi:secreted trypsin-like serine protease